MPRGELSGWKNDGRGFVWVKNYGSEIVRVCINDETVIVKVC